MTDRKFGMSPEKEFCSNPDCPDIGKRGLGNIVKYGHDRNGRQRFRCNTCGSVFVETKEHSFLQSQVIRRPDNLNVQIAGREKWNQSH